MAGGSVNLMMLLGYVGADPEVRVLGDGTRMVRFRVAASEAWKDKASGERRERTEWVPVVIFNEHLGAIAEKYLVKGSQVYLEGSLHTRTWTGEDGEARYITELVLPKYRGELKLMGGKRREPGGGGYEAGFDEAP